MKEHRGTVSGDRRDKAEKLWFRKLHRRKAAYKTSTDRQ